MAGSNEKMVDMENAISDLEVNAKKRCDSGTVFTSPKCLIKAENGKFIVNKETLQQIATVDKTLVVIAIAGLYRTGKSYLLTRLAGEYSGFPLGNNIQSKTKGIWAWCVEHPRKNNEQLLLLDTEGLGDIEKGDPNHDNKIFTMATLLSSTLVYNAKGAFDQDALQKLHFVVDLAKNVKVNNKQADDEGGQLDVYLPDFILVLRDFCLEMKLDGKSITSDEYLDHCLLLKKGSTEGEIRYNAPRLQLRKFFKNRRCFTMVPPGDHTVLRKLESLTDKDLHPDFVADVEEFLDYVYREAKPFGTRNESPINGSMFATLVETYMEAFNKGEVPCIDTTFQAMAEKENQKAIEIIFDNYKEKMEGLELPTKDELDFSNAHRTEKEAADESYLQMVIMDDYLKFKKLLSENIQGHFTQLRDKNKKLSTDTCETKLKELYGPISERVKSGGYLGEDGYEAYQRDLHVAKEKYHNSESVGFMKDRVFLQFLERQESEKQEVLRKNMHLKEAEKKRKLDEEVKKIAEEQERLKKLEQENLERERRKMEKLKKKELENLEKKMKEDMEREKRKTEEALKKKEEECRRLEMEGLRREAERERKEKELMRKHQEERDNTWGSWFYKYTFGLFG